MPGTCDAIAKNSREVQVDAAAEVADQLRVRGPLQPRAPNARRKPMSLNPLRIDQVSGVATPGSASPTFTFDHTRPRAITSPARSAGASRLPWHRRDGPRLQHVDGGADQRPLHVARVPEGLLDPLREHRELADRACRQGLAHPVLGGDVLFQQTAVVEVSRDRLLADDVIADPAAGLVDPVGVRRDASVHHRAAEPVGGVDDDLASVAGERVHGEHHARHVGRHEGLDDDAHAAAAICAATRRAHAEGPQVADHARRDRARPHVADRGEQRVLVTHAEHRLVEACARALRVVLVPRRRAHRDDAGAVGDQRAEALPDGLVRVRGDRQGTDDLRDRLEPLGGDLAGRRDEQRVDAIARRERARHRLLGHGGRDGEARRDREPGPHQRREPPRLAPECG